MEASTSPKKHNMLSTIQPDPGSCVMSKLGSEMGTEPTRPQLSTKGAHAPSPSDTDLDTELVASAFFPDTLVLSSKPDLALLSSDGVHFYVHSFLLKEQKAFGDFIPSTHRTFCRPAVVALCDSSEVLNIILHAIYEMPCAQFNHTITELVTAVDRMPFYGIQPNAIVTPNSPLYGFILSFSPLYPLQTYALAARHRIDTLAVTCSSRLLSFPLHSISNEAAETIGPVYLKKLFDLHRRRRQELRDLLVCPLGLHPLLGSCSYAKQRDLNRAWTLTATYFMLDEVQGHTDVSNHMLETTFSSLLDFVKCEYCRQMVKDQIKQAIKTWSMSKNTIESSSNIHVFP